MKQLNFIILLTVLMSMVGAKAFAYDIAVENEDGVTIYYNYISDGKELEVTYYKDYNNTGYKSIKTIVIPEKVNYMGRTRKVTSIGEGVFNHSSLTSVTIPNSVTSIGGLAFYYCSGLTSVTIPNSVTSIGVWAFNGCSGLTSVNISDLEAWCKISFEGFDSNPLYFVHHLFLNGTEIKDLVIPNSVTSIGDWAFNGCSGLTSVTIPNSVTSIGNGAFYYCSGLTSVTIPNSVTSIGDYAFYYCSGLTSVNISDLEAWCKISFGGSSSNPLSYANHLFLNGTEIKDLVIPNSVTSIGDYAFYYCSGLTSVTIPNSVTSIGTYAFNFSNNEGKLVEITSLIEEPMDIAENVFSEGLYSNASLYVPIGTMEKYKEKTGWKNFVWIEESSTGINDIKQETTTVSHYYNLNGQEISQPRKGLNIVKMSNGKTKKVLVK